MAQHVPPSLPPRHPGNAATLRARGEVRAGVGSGGTGRPDKPEREDRGPSEKVWLPGGPERDPQKPGPEDL